MPKKSETREPQEPPKSGADSTLALIERAQLCRPIIIGQLIRTSDSLRPKIIQADCLDFKLWKSFDAEWRVLSKVCDLKLSILFEPASSKRNRY